MTDQSEPVVLQTESIEFARSMEMARLLKQGTPYEEAKQLSEEFDPAAATEASLQARPSSE